jgi:serine protease Do
LRANTGAGYAIPVDTVKAFLPRLRQGKDIERGYTGIELDNRALTRGVRVKMVRGGSPADEERMREGDIILSVNGKSVNNAREWVNRLSRLTAGKTVTLKIKRKNRSRTVRLTLGVDPARARAAEKKAARKDDEKKSKKKDREKKDGKK